MQKKIIASIIMAFAQTTIFSNNVVSGDSTINKEETRLITIQIDEGIPAMSLNEINITQKKINEARKKIDELDKSDKKEWFIEYKKIQEEYSEWIDTDETIYDCFTEEELDLLFKIVEAEVTGKYYFESKTNVASVIFNRLYDEDFPDDLIKLLKEKRQFTPYWDGRYKKVEVTETTRLACEFAFQIEDTTNGCLYFDKCNGNSWNARNRKYAFTDEVGHDFYY